MVMKESVVMRALFCKIHSPFMCFCKPSAAHIYAPVPLKSENTQVDSTAQTNAVCDASVKGNSGVKEEHDNRSLLKSCIRRVPCPSDGTEEVRKKRVQWMDKVGKQLAEIKEFEPSETGDTDSDEESSHCICVIL